MQDLNQLPVPGGFQQEVHHRVDDDVFLGRGRKRQQQHLRQLFGSQERKNLQLQRKQKGKMLVVSGGEALD